MVWLQLLNVKHFLFLIEITFGSPDLQCQLCWIFRKFLKITFGRVVRSKSYDSKYCTVTSLTVYSVIAIFRQVLQNFQNAAFFKTIVKKKFCQWLNQNICQCERTIWTDKVFFWKLHVFKNDIFPLSQFQTIFRKEL